MATADYKLVKLDGTRIVTGQQLKDILTDFTIPSLPVLPPEPPKPVRQTGESQAEFDARYLRWFNGEYADWKAILSERTAINAAFEQTLRGTFKIALYGKTGKKLPNGSPVIDWFIPVWGSKGVIAAPPYPAFALKLTGLRTNAPKDIDWICFNTLNT